MNAETKLTRRQLEAVCFLANGLTLEETAQAMFVSLSTVNKTLAAARRKTGTRTIPHLVSFAIAQDELVWSDDDSERSMNQTEIVAGQAN